ncbi:beta-galactosidase [Verrucomicrobiota bacterium]
MSTRDSTPMTAEVMEHNGAPALFVNGRPHSGLMFYSPDVESDTGRRRWGQFGDVGVHLLSSPFNIGAQAVNPEPWDFGAFNRKLAAATEVDPQALVMPRLGIVPGRDWTALHPDEEMQHLDPHTLEPAEGCGAGVSFTSRLWRETMTPILRAFIRHAEATCGEHLLGYHVSAGAAAEWSYLWDPGMSDYSPVHAAAYRAWLAQRYGDDVERLREAWQDAAVTFETVEVPRDRARPKGAWSLLDPAKDLRLIDYQTFHSEAVAEAILYFCGIAKSVLRELGRCKLIGAFYGYYFWDAGWPCGYHNSGHHALARVLISPDVDVLCAPYCYAEKSAGGQVHPQFAAGSMRLHGKLVYNEEDSGTHKVPADMLYCGKCPDLRTSLGVLRRNAAGAMMHTTTQWWMDIIAQGWFDDPDIQREIAGLVGMFEERFQADRRPNTQIAVIVNEANARYLRYDGALSDALIPRQMSELTALGAPFQTFDACDLERLFTQPEGDAYRLVVFMDCVYLSPEQRRAIREHAARNNRTLLWCYAAGLITEQGLSLEAMAELTGIKADWWDRTWPAKVFTFLTGDRITYGTDEYIGPWLYGTDPDAEALGWMRGKTDRPFVNAPGLMAKDFNAWRSVWSAAPAIQAPVLRELARRAGVHIYTEGGDQVITAPGFLALHAAFKGEHTVHLPQAATVADAITGETVAGAATSFTVTLDCGDTGLWRVSV